MTETAKSDWVRVGKFMRGEWPKPLAPIHEWLGRDDKRTWDSLSGAPYLVIDTEYVPETQHMWCLGIGGPKTHITQWWPEDLKSASRFCIRDLLKELIARVPVVFQNAMADLPILEHNLGIKYEDFKQIEDLMFLQSLLWCELPHSLAFIASVCGQHEKMKHLNMRDPRYNAGDVAETIAGWEQYSGEMLRDPQTEYVYRECMLPLIPIILESQRLGIRVDRQAVVTAGDTFNNNRVFAIQTANAYAGFPINVGSSDQLRAFMQYDLNRKKIKSMDEDAVAGLRTAILPFDPQEEVTIESTTSRINSGAHPILEARVLYARAQQYLSHYVQPMLARSDGRVYAHFHPWTQNTGRWSTVDPPLAQLPHTLRSALLPDKGWIWFEFDWQTIELRLVAALANDTLLLEAFAKGWDLHSLHCSQFFNWDTQEGRAGYVRSSLPTVWATIQDISIPNTDSEVLQLCVSGFSTTDGYQLCPLDAWWAEALRASSHNTGWPGRGRTSQEWRQERQYTGQPGTDDTCPTRDSAQAATWHRQTLEREWWLWVYGGGCPPDWKGGDDPRRIFAKAGVFRLCYGGLPEGAPSIPGAKALNLPATQLVAASRRWIASHPAIKKFWKEIERQALTRRQLRTFLGRRWNFLSHDRKRILRQMYDFPMQGGVADIMNLTLISIKRALQTRVRLAYTMHDSIKLQVKVSPFLDGDLQTIKEIAQAEFNVGGIKMCFPAEFKRRDN